VTLADRPDDLTEESLLALGRCQMELGDAALADLAFVPLIDSRDSARRQEARFQHARALRITGRYEEALAVLQGSPDRRAGNDLLLALAGAGRGAEAVRVVDSLLASNDTTLGWDSVVAALGHQNPRLASAVIGRLTAGGRLSPDAKAQRLYDDAVRLAASDSAASMARLRDAASVPGRVDGAERARLALLRRSLSRARTLDDLAPHVDSLAALVQRGSAAAGDAGLLATPITRLRALPDSAPAGSPQGDLRFFLGAETAREELQAPALAANLFRQLAVQWPASPYAPKAFLAAQMLDPEDGASAQATLDSLYPASPYLAMLRGEEAPGYQALEDSLQAFALSQFRPAVGADSGAVRGRGVGQPQRRRDNQPEQPGAGRRRVPTP
jgi:hypothetical protein